MYGASNWRDCTIDVTTTHSSQAGADSDHFGVFFEGAKEVQGLVVNVDSDVAGAGSQFLGVKFEGFFLIFVSFSFGFLFS